MDDRRRLFGEDLGSAERVDPNYFAGDIVAEHLARYRWAAKGVRGARVLDIACGTGYGATLLRRAGARSVVSVDVSMEALSYGTRAYRLRAVVGDGMRLPFRNGAFDAIVTLETVEHVADAVTFIGELSRVLRIGGMLHLSTPNLELSSGTNPYHLREFTLGELTVMLDDAGLTTIRHWGQHMHLRDYLWRNVKGFRRAAFELYRRSWIVPSGLMVRADPVYLCVKARRGKLLAP